MSRFNSIHKVGSSLYGVVNGSETSVSVRTFLQSCHLLRSSGLTLPGGWPRYRVGGFGLD